MTTAVTACPLCSRNCGLTMDVEPGRLSRIKGDRAHPLSAGYLCQKAGRLDAYQHHAGRLTSPLRRRPDGGFEPIGWDVALREIAERLLQIRADHGGRAFAFYGGGGQGNHLGGIYGGALRAAMGSQYYYSALAQEKTGDFWVNGRLFGRQTCHVSEDVERAEVVLFIGTNPWQAHGIPNARQLLREIAGDPARTMIVVDPRRTETAALADLHLQLRPGTDAFLLAAMLALIVREDLVDTEFLAARTHGFEPLAEVLETVDVAAYAARAGVPLADLERTARTVATAASAVVRVDLGIQQSLHSTLNSYLEKLLFLLTGNFGRAGGNNLHTFLLPLIGHSDVADDDRIWRTVAAGMPPISKLYPPNLLPGEITTDDPRRVRALWVDSANPWASGADTAAYEAARERLELLVTVDVALSETARVSDYVLPAASQFEKWEATFFNLEFPTNAFHLRAPILPPTDGTLAEPELYRRLLVAMGELPERFALLERVARADRRAKGLGLLPAALAATLKLRPRLAKYAAFVLMQTLGKTLPAGAAAAAPLWFGALRYAARHGDAVRRTGLAGDGRMLGEALFERILTSRSGCLLSTHEYGDTWDLVRHPDRRVQLAIPELLEALRALADEPAPADRDRPLVLIAGERRAWNANTIYRDAGWRRGDREGALRIHPLDAGPLGLTDGAAADCASVAGTVRVQVLIDESLRPGVVSLPHGYGLTLVDADGVESTPGAAVNRLTSAGHRDPLSGTPYHKYVPVRLTAVG